MKNQRLLEAGVFMSWALHAGRDLCLATTPPAPADPDLPSPDPSTPRPPAPDLPPPEIDDPDPAESPVPVREPPGMPPPMAYA